MGALAAALEQRARYQTTNAKNPAYWAERLFGGGTATATGLHVGPADARRVSAILGGTRMVGEDVGGLPLPVMRPHPTRPKASVEARDHWAWDLLNWKPCPEMTALDFRGTLTGHAVLQGTGFAEIVMDQGMRVRELWPLRPDRTRIVRAGVGVTVAGVPDGELCFIVTLPSGEQRVLRRHQVFTLPGFGGDGLTGYSVVAHMREAIALSLAAEEHGARFYANSARPDIVLKHPGNPSDAARKHLRESFEARHQGLSNAHRIAILEEGLSIEQVGMKLVDAEYTATREHAVRDFARALRIPVSKMGLPGDTKATAEQEDLDYSKALTPWALRWTQRLRFHGITPDPYYAHHTLQALVQSDMKTRGEYLHTMKLDGNMSANTILAIEDQPLSDHPLADDLLLPLNMVPVSSLDANGMTYAQRVEAAGVLVRVGYDPASIAAALGLGDLQHTGLVPVTVQLDPEASAALAARVTGGTQA